MKVFCHSNQLTSFKISKFKNTTLLTLVITNNHLSGTLNLRTSTHLDKLWCYNNPSLTSVCVASVAKAETSSQYKKDALATWTNNCGWVAREGVELTEMDNAPIEAVSVYPNPAKGLIQIRSGEAIVHVSIKKMDGSSALEVEGASQIDISYLMPGIYMVEVSTSHGIEKKKLVVQ